MVAAPAHAVTCAVVQFERVFDAEVIIARAALISGRIKAEAADASQVAVRNLDGLAMAGHVIKAGFAPLAAASAPPALLADAAASFVRQRVSSPPVAVGRRSSAPLALPVADEAARHAAQLASAQRYAAQLSSPAGTAQLQPPASPLVVLDNLAAPHELDDSLEACVHGAAPPPDTDTEVSPQLTRAHQYAQ